jgi:hypothetical protein
MPLSRLAWLPLLICFGFTAKFLVILQQGAENGSAAPSLTLALGCAALAAWLFRVEPRGATAPSIRGDGVANAAPTLRAAEAPDWVERRRHPRRPVNQAVRIEWRHAGREAARLQDLSRGGARIREAAAAPIGQRGLLHVPGLSLPVPFTIVECLPETGLHIRFDLEGMGLEAMEQQLDQLIERLPG